MITLNVNPLRELPTASGDLLDRCAEALGLPPREIVDPTGHICTMESDAAYRRRLAERLRKLADSIVGGVA